MPYFLTAQDAYRMIQRELPPDTYPDGAPSKFFSTADSYATAQNFEDLYSNLSAIYANYWPQTCDSDFINNWEVTVFGAIQSTATLAQRQAAVVAKLQLRRGITKQDMINIVLAVVPAIGAGNIEIIEYNQSSGGWMIGLSPLGVSTFLSGGRGVDLTASLFPGVDICGMEIAQNPGLVGLTTAQLAADQNLAYTYEVRIYGYVLSAAQYAAIDAALTIGEPGRSAHVITSGLSDYLRLTLNGPYYILTEGGDRLTTEGGSYLELDGDGT